MVLWQKYLLRHLLQVFFFLLLCVFVIYILVDFSIHGVKFLSLGKTTFIDLSLYYLRLFARHLELFISLSFLLSSLKVLLDLNGHQELVALQMAGLSKKRLLFPFFALAALLSFTCYCNSQWLSPDAQDAADAFRKVHLKTKKKQQNVYNIGLEDDTELIYQNFDPTHQELFDVFWVQSSNSIWYMKYLNISSKPVRGRFVDHFACNSEGQFEKQESFPSHEFPKLAWGDEVKLQRFIPFENRSLSTLFQQASALTANRESALSHLHYKIAMPLLPFLILLFISPIAMRFSRTRPTLLIVAGSLFAFIGFITFMDASLILGENQVLPPSLAIWFPFAALTTFALPSFSKMR